MDNQSKYFFDALKKPLVFVGFLWLFHFYRMYLAPGRLRLGVFPREMDGLLGVITSPLAHSDIGHLISNSLPLLVLMTIIFYFYRRIAWPSFLLIYVLTGLAVWLLARPVYHIGASGVVYGLVSFIFWLGIFRRNLKSIILSLVIVIMYSGYFYGLLPNQEGISWESHLFGGVVGIVIAFLFRNMIERDEIVVDPWADESDEEDFLLDRDTFKLTKWEREERDRMQQGL